MAREILKNYCSRTVASRTGLEAIAWIADNTGIDGDYAVLRFSHELTD